MNEMMGKEKIGHIIYKRGDVYMANLPKIENSHIQYGVRPVIITSNEPALNNAPVIQCIPVTSKVDSKSNIPVHVRLYNESFLRPSMALVELEGLVDKSRLIKKIGTLTEDEMFEIDMAIFMQRSMNKKYLYKIAMKLCCA
jgi:mRNA interferase MazF